ncbi:MAG: CDP-alcohol phosphatidyltransferase family protein [Patescibacteria group bacterium]
MEINKISDIKKYQKAHDSIFSKLITRKISVIFSFYLIKRWKQVTPNKVSLISFITAVVAIGLFLADNYFVRLLGVVFLQISFALDCSDGEIARIKEMSSKFGAWMDSVLDRFKEVMMFGALTFIVYNYAWDTSALLIGSLAIILWLLVGFLREAKKSSWPEKRTAELYITDNIYIGTVDTTIYFVCFAIIIHMELMALWVFAILGLILLVKQIISAWQLEKKI